jgi:CheY-like chemotaxis protein
MKQLLIIDDQETIRFSLKRYFGRMQYEVDCAGELEEAEALIAYTAYDLVIADLSLTAAGCSEGLELIRFLRTRWPRARVIILTAYGMPAVEREALRRGADVLLHKPQPLAELARVAGRLLEARP